MRSSPNETRGKDSKIWVIYSQKPNSGSVVFSLMERFENLQGHYLQRAKLLEEQARLLKGQKRAEILSLIESLTIIGNGYRRTGAIK